MLFCQIVHNVNGARAILLNIVLVRWPCSGLKAAEAGLAQAVVGHLRDGLPVPLVIVHFMLLLESVDIFNAEYTNFRFNQIGHRLFSLGSQWSCWIG